MRWWVVVALVVVLGCKKSEEPRRSSVPPSGDAVAERLKRALADAFPGARIELTPDDMLIVGPGSGSGEVQVSLDNIRRSCASSEAECEGAINGVVENTKKTSTQLGDKPAAPAPTDKALIRLTPKPSEWLDSADAAMAKVPDKIEDNRIVRQKLAGDLWWVYVVDEPTGMRLINAKEMKSLGMTLEQLHALAVANLAAQYPKLELLELAPGVWTMEPGDYLDSARLALTDQWKAEAKARGGSLIVTAPARSRVFVSNAPQMRDRFDLITHKAFTEEDHPLSEVVLVWTDKGWKAEK